MRFEDVLSNGKLWAVVYDEDTVDVLTKSLRDWVDPSVLFSFFNENKEERSHTLEQLTRMETVRNYLIENSIFDSDGIKDYLFQK